jgi:hypothetical protein
VSENCVEFYVASGGSNAARARLDHMLSDAAITNDAPCICGACHHDILGITLAKTSAISQVSFKSDLLHASYLLRNA